MGFSSSHSTSAPLVLNLDTGSITPQCHVVLDDWFATVCASVAELPPFQEAEWASMFGTHTFHLDPGGEEEEELDPSTPQEVTPNEAYETKPIPEKLAA